MAAPFSNSKIRVPKGFPTVLEHLTKEVLRFQPNNIYEFARDYFSDLLTQRSESKSEDLAELCAALEDRYYNNHAFREDVLNSDEHHQAALKIQTNYRQHIAKKQVQKLREDEAIIVIMSHIGEENTTTEEKLSDDAEQLKQRFVDGEDTFEKFEMPIQKTCNNAEDAENNEESIPDENFEADKDSYSAKTPDLVDEGNHNAEISVGDENDNNSTIPIIQGDVVEESEEIPEKKQDTIEQKPEQPEQDTPTKEEAEHDSIAKDEPEQDIPVEVKSEHDMPSNEEPASAEVQDTENDVVETSQEHEEEVEENNAGDDRTSEVREEDTNIDNEN